MASKKGVIDTVIVTDCIYRSAIAAIYTLNNLGEEIIAVTTDIAPNPPAFKSKYIKHRHVLSSDKSKYSEELLKLCSEYSKPVILPIGVFTLNVLSDNADKFKDVADFAVAKKDVLDRLNNKKRSKELAIEAGISVPQKSDSFPMVVKPFCGEKFGLKASERYKIVHNTTELEKAVSLFSNYDDVPIVEEYIEGDGVGVSVVIGNDGVERSAFCHRRLSEYPASGGPSCSLVTFFDKEIIARSVDMLKRAGFVGIAMVEYKVQNGIYYFLEVNPRIWGSFGATYKTGSDFVNGYLSAARGTVHKFMPSYKIGKVKFIPNIFAASISYFKARKIVMGFKTLLDAFNPFVPNAVFSIYDPIPFIYDLFRKRR